MSNQVWRFSYKEDSLDSIIGSGELVFPEMNPHTSGKHNEIQKIISEMSVGAFIILANYKMHENTAIVRVAGQVTSLKNDQVIVSWKKLVPSLSLHPHKIGAEQWINENVFLINGPRVRQFKLDSLKKKLFG